MPGAKGLNPRELAHRWVKDLLPPAYALNSALCFQFFYKFSDLIQSCFEISKISESKSDTETMLLFETCSVTDERTLFIIQLLCKICCRYIKIIIQKSSRAFTFYGRFKVRLSFQPFF